MAAVSYIGPTELGSYGLIGVPAIYLSRASSLIDAVLGRPEGITWTPDANGWPCYMTRLTPRLTLNFTGPILPGVNVVVPVAGNIDTNPDQLIGEVIILDRLQTGILEACVVGTATATTITLNAVLFTHPGPVTADFGMVITELKQMPEGRSMAHLCSWPIARIHSGVGRYGYGRHGSDMYGYREEQSLLTIMQVFGSVPLWQPFPLAAASWDPLTGHVWIPSGLLLAYFNEVQIRYVAGWSQTNIPETIKQAVAALAVAMQTNLLPGSIISYKAGDTQIVRAAATILDADTLSQLNAFRAYAFV
jgi:hypothetical protein